jgi:hypothetical protein
VKHGYACPIVLGRGAQSDAEIASKKEGYDSHLVMGENDHRQCGPGWHDLEVWPPKVRWTKTEAIAYLNLNCHSKLYIVSVAKRVKKGVVTEIRGPRRDHHIISGRM